MFLGMGPRPLIRLLKTNNFPQGGHSNVRWSKPGLSGRACCRGRRSLGVHCDPLRADILKRAERSRWGERAAGAG
jgi:lipopolysaccharide/colanic/teichoic acid biosynthesis glycosyltransferase